MEEVPFEDRTVPRVEIDWDRSAWWWYPLSRAIHPAIRMTSLAFSLVAVLFLQLGFNLARKWFSPTFQWDSLLGWSSQNESWIPRLKWIGDFPELSINHLAYLSFLVVWLALVSALFGGVLARKAAIELGLRTMGSWTQAVSVSTRRLVSYLWAAGLHLVAYVIFLVPFFLLGWVSQFGTVAAAIAGGLLVILGLPMIFATGRSLLSLLVCFPLSVCAISLEKRADAFEGFSRSNAYFFQRPVVAIILVVALVLIGQVGAALVYWTITFGWGLIEQAFAAGSLSNENAQRFVDAGAWVASNLIVAFWFSFFWSASAAAYLILRRSVDDTPLEDIDMLETELERNPPQIPTTSQPAADSESSEAT